jgi:hypothetical protein
VDDAGVVHGDVHAAERLLRFIEQVAASVIETTWPVKSCWVVMAIPC